MEVIHDLHWIRDFPAGCVATVGEFDGVHRGHRVILLEMFRSAVVAGCPTVVVTYEHSESDASGGRAPQPQLTSMTQKLEILDAIGVDVAVVLPVEQILSPAGAGDRDEIVDWIVDEVLTNRLKARVVVVGEDFHFGPRRRLTSEVFRESGKAAGFEVVQIPLDSRKTAAGEVVSAPSIRKALAAGEVAKAAEMLGRPYEIRATVVSGDRRGRTIGFPTANLPVVDALQVPADGVYAGWYTRPNGDRAMSAINIGKRPTFKEIGEPSLVEAHLLDFSGDLYGEATRLQFVERLRSERRFDGIDALQQQLSSDIDQARRLLTKDPN